MRYGNYSFSLLLLLSSCSQLALPIRGDRPVVPGVPSGSILQVHPSNVHSKDPVGLLYSEPEGFSVIDRNEGAVRRTVPSYRTESILRKMDTTKLTAFLKEGGYVRVHKLGEGDYKLVPHVRVLGGGPVLAAIFYAGTKAICYGGMVAGGVAAIASTGGGAAVGTAATGAFSAAGVSGVGTAAAVIGANAAATSAATTLTAASAGAGGMGIVAGVETASTFMYTVGMMIPWI